MFSKFKLLGGATVLTLLVVGCGLKIGEKPRKERELALADDKFGCLNKFGQRLDAYFKGKMTDADVTEFVGCFQRSLQLFEAYTEGDDPEYYKPMEIRNFLAKFFIRDRVITDEHVHQLMRLKASWVGGDEQIITREEFRHFIEMLDTIKTEAVRLRPFMPVLNPTVGFARHKDKKTLPSLEDATRALMESAERIGRIINPNGKDYALRDFETYLVELRRFVDWEKDRVGGTTSRDWSEFIRNFKALTVHPDAEYLRPEEWRPLLKSAAAWYALWLKYRYEIKPEDILVGQGLDNFIETIETSFQWIQQAIEAQPEKVITFKQLDEMAEAIGGMGMFPSSMRVETIQKTLKPLLTKLFGSPDMPASQRRISGLDRSVLSRARAEFYRWADAQQYLDRELQKVVPELQAQRLPNPPDIDVLRTLASFDFSQLLNVGGVGNPTVSLLYRLKQKVRPLYKHGDPRAYIVNDSLRNQNQIISSYYDLSLKNIMSPALRLIIAGYSEDPHRAKLELGLEASEMRSFIQDIKGLAEDLKIMHPKAEGVGERLFLEGNLFTYSGNGINPRDPADDSAHLLVFEEGLELLSFMLTNGHLVDSVYMDLKDPSKAKPCEVGPGDVFHLPRIKRQCFLERYKDLLVKHLDNAEGMRSFINQMNSDEWQRFMEIMLASVSKYDDRTVRQGEDLTQPGSQWVQYTQLGTMNMIVHYVEAIMTRYDRNSRFMLNEDGRLNEEEALAAYPTFKGLLHEVLKKKNLQLTPKEEMEVFLYILSYNTIPETCSLWSQVATKAKMLSGRWMGWDIELDRLKLLESFFVITSVASGDAKDSCPPLPGVSDSYVAP